MVGSDDNSVQCPQRVLILQFGDQIKYISPIIVDYQLFFNFTSISINIHGCLCTFMHIVVIEQVTLRSRLMQILYVITFPFEFFGVKSKISIFSFFFVLFLFWPDVHDQSIKQMSFFYSTLS